MCGRQNSTLQRCSHLNPQNMYLCSFMWQKKKKGKKKKDFEEMNKLRILRLKDHSVLSI